MSSNGDLPTFDTLTRIVAQLRSPEGCPWDREQTHQSIRGYLLEECYEALQALDQGEPEKLKDELGDVLLQVLLHSQIAAEAGEFTIDDVVAGLVRKLIRRHPHVFGDDQASTAGEVEVNWEAIKKKELGRKSVLEGVPQQMPALAYSHSIHRRAANAGFDWADVDGVMDKLTEEVAEFQEAGSREEQEEEMGDVLTTLVNVGRKLGLDLEAALRMSNRKFYLRFSGMERLCRDRGIALRELSPSQQEELWQEVKAMIAEEKEIGESAP